MEAPLIIDILEDSCLSVAADSMLCDAIHLMHENKQSCVMITENNKPIGIITESDAVGLLAESFQGVNWDNLQVGHLMTSPVIAASLDLNILEAIIIAHGGNIRHIPVTDEKGNLLGVANQTQLVKALVAFCRSGDLW